MQQEMMELEVVRSGTLRCARLLLLPINSVKAVKGCHLYAKRVQKRLQLGNSSLLLFGNDLHGHYSRS